jgi:hypothetical protein
VIPKNRTFVEEILKTLGLSVGNTKGIIDVCKGLSLNDSFWVAPKGFERHPSINWPEGRLEAIEKHIHKRVRQLLGLMK